MASTIALQGLAFVAAPIFSSILGTANYGIAAVYLTWVQIASISFSLQAGGAIAVARTDFPLEDQNKYQSSVFSLATLSFACFSTLVLLFAMLTERFFSLNIPMILFGLMQAWGMYCVTYMNLKFTYEFKAGRNFILSVSASGLTILASLILIHFYPSEINYWGRIIGQSSVYFLIGIVLFVGMLYKGKTVFQKEYWIYTLPITIPTIFHSLAHIVLNQSDKVMIQGMIGNSDAGIYALASTFSAVVNAIWHAFNNSWVPFYYEYTRKGQIEEMKQHANNYMELFTIVAIGFILLSREVFHLYAADKAFWPGTDYIPLLALGYYFVFIYSFPVNFEFYHKRTKTIAAGTISAAALNIGLNYFLILAFGAIGAVVTTAISHVLLFMFHFLSARRMNEATFPFDCAFFLPGMFAVCGACVLYWFTRGIWLVRWGGGVLLGVYLLVKIIKRKEIF